VVWTTDNGSVGVRLATFRLRKHAMSDSNDRREDRRRELECLSLASDLRQPAKETPDPDLKAHGLRMTKQWSDEADEPTKDDTAVDKGLG
jgi:hypothetical protein